MKKPYIVFLFVSILAQSAWSLEAGDVRVGIDVAVPYVLSVDGNESTRRANLGLGLDGRYFLTRSVNLGMRASFDLEERSGSNRSIGLAPGVQYMWMPGEDWNPYIRFDVPFILRGATNTSGDANQQDLGVGGGLGLAWNLGETLGIEQLAFRYDFTLNYMVGLGSALDVLSIEFAKFGFDYRF